MKKGSVKFILLASFLVFGMIALAGAQTSPGSATATLIGGFSDFFKQIFGANGLGPVLSIIVGDTGTSDSSGIFIAKLLLMILVLAITYSIVERIPLFAGSDYIIWITSIVVAVLGIRFISAGAIQTIVLSHSAYAVALTAIIPFILYFVFVETGLSGYPPLLRKLSWIFYAVIFIGLWFMRYNEIQTGLVWIYPISALVALFMLILDGTIQKLIREFRRQRLAVVQKTDATIPLKLRLIEAQEALAKGAISLAEYNTKKKDLEKRITAIESTP